MPTKRSNGKWIARVIHHGKVHYAGTNHPTKREATRAEETKRDGLRRFGDRKPETVDEFANRWPDDYPRDAAATRLTYRYAARQIGKAFEGIPLRDVDPKQARKWATTAPESTRRVARTMFSDALRDELVDRNPFSNLRLPQSRGRRDIEVITEAQVYELRDLAIEEHGSWGRMFGAWIVWQAFTMMRPGETAILERTDIDFTQGEIEVSKNLDSTGAVKWPKNGRPDTIVLFSPARDALRGLVHSLEPIELYDERRRTSRMFYPTFRAKRGGAMTEPKVLAAWNPVRAAFRAKHPESTLQTPYELRHAGATFLLERGFSAADVAEQMRHSSERLVQERYGHPSKQLARERLKRAYGENVANLSVAKESHGA